MNSQKTEYVKKERPKTIKLLFEAPIYKHLFFQVLEPKNKKQK